MYSPSPDIANSSKSSERHVSSFQQENKLSSVIAMGEIPYNKDTRKIIRYNGDLSSGVYDTTTKVTAIRLDALDSRTSSSEITVDRKSVYTETSRNEPDHKDESDYRDSGITPQPRTWYFILQLQFRLVTRVGDLGTDIWVLYLSYITKGQRGFFWWLLSFQFLPFPILILNRWRCSNTICMFMLQILMDALHLSQLKELLSSWNLGVYTDQFFVIHSTEALLTGFPEAVLQYLLVLEQWNDESGWIFLVSTMFSAISVGNSMYAFECGIYDLQDMEKEWFYRYLDSVLLFLYFALDMVINLFIIALCIHFYIPYGCVILTWRYFYRSMLNFAVYYDRGAIYRTKNAFYDEERLHQLPESNSDSIIAMIVFAFFAAGPMQLLTDLPFNHDIAFKGGRWLFVLHAAAVLDLAAVLVVGYFVNEEIEDYLFFTCIFLQVLKIVLDITVYAPMLLAKETPKFAESVKHDIQRRFSRLVRSRSQSNADSKKLTRAKSLPVVSEVSEFFQGVSARRKITVL